VQGFAGFPEGKVRVTPLPNPFFSDLLPAIDHLGELKVTLYAFWALARKEGRYRYLSDEELAADGLLLDGLALCGGPAERVLADSLERAVARGTLLLATIDEDGRARRLYFLNSPRGRTALRALADGEWKPGKDAPVDLQLERPNVFRLYEQNFGPLTPMIAETLRDTEESYPALWIEDAMRIAVANNVRKWNYVLAILKDWHTRGRDEREDLRDTEKARRRYTEGEFSDFIEH
jgi:DnaD/phage-associated family protein